VPVPERIVSAARDELIAVNRHAIATVAPYDSESEKDRTIRHLAAQLELTTDALLAVPAPLVVDSRAAVEQMVNAMQRANRPENDMRNRDQREADEDASRSAYRALAEAALAALLSSGVVEERGAADARAKRDLLLWLDEHGVDTQELDMALETFVEPHGLSITWRGSVGGGSRG
jgi:hypothetical protein